MSGPKVVRVVTREEVLQICEGLLARVDAAITQWERVATRNALADEATIREVRQRRQRFETWLQGDRFLDIQKHAPREEDWLLLDIEKRLEAKLSAEVAARQAARNTQRTATTLLEQLAARQVVVPPDLRRALEGRDEATLGAAVTRAFGLLTQGSGTTGTSAAQRDLAQRLKTDDATPTLEAWLAAQGGAALGLESDPRVLAVERQLALLGALGSKDEAAPLAGRLEEALREGDRGRQGLLLDALGLDVAAAVKRRRELETMRQEAVALLAEATAMGAQETCQEALGRVAAAAEAAQARPFLEDAREALKRAAAARAAAAGRDAVLRGLRQLGYEVNEGMATAWAKDGRLVVRNPQQRGYGVELGGRGDAGKLQVRAVGFGGAGDPTADRAAETRWCGDFQELQGLLAAAGGELAIERATPVGTVAVKRVEEVVAEEIEVEELRQMRRD